MYNRKYHDNSTLDYAELDAARMCISALMAHKIGLINWKDTTDFMKEQIKKSIKEAEERKMENAIITCEYCGAIIENKENMIEIDGKYYCDEDCAHEDGWEKCAECGEWIASDYIVCVDEGTRREAYVCEDCASNYYFRCDDCGNYFSDYYIHTDDYGTCLCNDCYDSGYVTCENCGRIVDSCYSHYDEYNNCDYCDECWEECGIGLDEYDYKPDPEFMPPVDELENPGEKNLYMGFEDEIDDGSDGRDLVRWIRDNYDTVYCKHDGSLSDVGIEIVSHPHTLRQHMNDNWETLFKKCLRYGYRSHDTSTCGLHVHVNRDFFGEMDSTEQDLNIAKVILLVNRFWESHIIPFSRRELEDLTHWARKAIVQISRGEKPESISQKLIETLGNKTGGYEKRYRSINLTNYNTIEFRIFRGTLKYSTFLATLQFVDTICRFAKKIDLDEIDNVKWEDIFAGVEYKELLDYLEEHTDFDPSLVENVLCNEEEEEACELPY